MTTVAITGISGQLGRALVPVLEEDPSITRIVGVDRLEPKFTGRNLEYYQMDVRSPDLAGAIAGADAIVHLAAVHDDPDEVMDNNVGGTRNVVDAASRVGAKALVFASSYSVYGAHADNDFPLTEASLVRPNPENVFARSKAEGEAIVRYFADEHLDSAVTTLRFAPIAGPDMPRNAARLLHGRLRLGVTGYDPPLQLVHVDDAAAAVALVLRAHLSGVFNVASDDSVEAPHRVIDVRQTQLEPAMANRVFAELARKGGPPLVTTGAELMYPRVLANAALRDAGFAPAHTTRETLRVSAEAADDLVEIGPLRFRRRSAALVGGTVGLLAIAALRGRRARRSS